MLRLLPLLLLMLGSSVASAQVANYPWSQSHQAVQFSDQQISHDPVTLVMPGVAFASGFSSYLENPASSALFDESFGSLGLVFRTVSEETRMLERSNRLGDNQTGVSNIGFVYRFPTVRGSLVWGAGYSQHSFYNRAMEIGGFNEASTITDFFKIPGSEYADVAYNTYAIDDGDEFGGWDESILRIGFQQYGDYLGIDQEAEIYQRGMAGDYSTFLATEFLENLMVGASVGLRSGRFRYERTFLEVDRENRYNGAIVDSNDDGTADTDIDSILLTDEIRSEFISLAVRAGVIYRAGEHLRVGLAYTLPSRLTVEEELDGRIITTMDNGTRYDDDLRTRFSYAVRSPSRLHLGLSVERFRGVTLSLSGEYVDHSATRVDFDADLFEQERDENRFISESYRSVWNLRAGLATELTDELTLRAGYGVRPSRFAEGGVREDNLSLGLGVSLSESARLELGAQYAMWRDEPGVVYSYTDYDYAPLPEELPNSRIRQQFATQDGNRLQVLATFQLFFP